MKCLFAIGLLALLSVSAVRALDLPKIREGEHFYPEVCLLPEKWLTKAMNLTCELLPDYGLLDHRKQNLTEPELVLLWIHIRL